MGRHTKKEELNKTKLKKRRRSKEPDKELRMDNMDNFMKGAGNNALRKVIFNLIFGNIQVHPSSSIFRPSIFRLGYGTEIIEDDVFDQDAESRKKNNIFERFLLAIETREKRYEKDDKS